MQDLFAGLAAQIDFDPGAREKYEALVASSNRVLDVGGRNSASASRKRLTQLNSNPSNTIVSTDIYDDYEPDIVDDICNSKLPSGSYDGIYCNAILEQ